MANPVIPDPYVGSQVGEALQSSALAQTFPGVSPLFQATWLSEIFRYRNQEYGAYCLRQQYHRNMMWGALLSILFVAALYGGTLLVEALREQLWMMTEYNETLHMTAPPPEKASPPPTPPVAPPPPPVRPSIAFVIPKVLDDEQVPQEYEPPTQEEMLNKNPGTVSTEGDPDGVDFPLDEPLDPPPPAVVLEEEPREPKETKPFIFVEQMPAFRGDLGEFLAAEIRYPEMARDNGISGTVVIQFVINEKGEITNPFILKDIGGGCGEEALRVVRTMPTWLAGAQRGRPVKVQMNLPVKFRLE